MINFDDYFDNVMTMKLILTNIVLILQVKPLMLFYFYVISAQRCFGIELEL